MKRTLLSYYPDPVLMSSNLVGSIRLTFTQKTTRKQFCLVSISNAGLYIFKEGF